MALRAAPGVDCSVWASVRDFFDPSITTSQYLADGYECAQYGNSSRLALFNDPAIPTPAPPAPRAPQTADEMVRWTPQQSFNTAADWAAKNIARIQAAEDSGSYNPSGNLPATATQLDKYKWPLILGGGALALILLVKVK